MTKVRLGELIRPVTGRAGDQDLPVYSVTKHRGFVPSREYFKKQVFSNDVSTYKVVDIGQLAYATIHLDEGSVGIAPETCIISPMYTVFAADESRVDPSFLLRYLKSPIAMTAYPRLGRGTAERRKAIPLDALARLEVPLPALPEQRRIAAILDEADELRRRRDQSLALIEELPSALFEESDQHGWRVAAVGEVAELQGGLTVNARRASLDRQMGYLRVANVMRGEITLDEVKELGVTAAEAARTALQVDDVLVVEGHGNADEVGRAARVRDLPFPLTPQNHLFRLRPRAGVVTGQFLEAAISTASARRFLRRVANTTSGLFASLQHRAFRGEL